MPTPNTSITGRASPETYPKGSGPLKPAKIDGLDIISFDASRRQIHSSRSSLHNDDETIQDGVDELGVRSDNQEVVSKRSISRPEIQDFFTKKHRVKTSSFLKPHTSFIGSQQSGLSTYEVKVELKEVDLENSYMCGFLTIHGLTELHPEITTFFKGEIVGPKFSFFTDRDSWGSNYRNDLQHWGRFPSFRKLDFNTENDSANEEIYRNYLNSEYLYMRWKEVFLVPDASVKDIRGASFAGFYYVCFNQLTGSVSGLYFHKCSVKFQQLELCHVPDGGCSASYEYQ